MWRPSISCPLRRIAPSAGSLLLVAPVLLALATAPGALHAQRTPATPSAIVPGTRDGARDAAAEDFDSFFRRFQEDSAFQRSRIRFPLPWFSMADDTTRRMTAREWPVGPIHERGETYPQLFDNFAMRLADTDERVYSIIGTASDIRQNYFFRRIKGLWYLVRVEDRST